jgi:aromatic ring-opening dioxygenase catalytic subunit (LigB family)
MESSEQPAIFLTHGAGPCWFVDGKDFPPFADIDKNSPGATWFRQLPDQLGENKPKAILVITAHWETSGVVNISAQSQHTDLYYDYSGFPKETYEIKFQPKGDLELSQKVLDLLKQSGIPAVMNPKRNFDHGVFIPLKLMYPDASIPVVSVSILDNYSPAEHIAIGKALGALRKQGVLIIGSGSITHGRASRSQSHAFVDAISHALQSLPTNEREQALMKWTALPYARENHGREDHLIPLHVVLGAAGSDKCTPLNQHLPKTLAAYAFS